MRIEIKSRTINQLSCSNSKWYASAVAKAATEKLPYMKVISSFPFLTPPLVLKMLGYLLNTARLTAAGVDLNLLAHRLQGRMRFTMYVVHKLALWKADSTKTIKETT